LDCIENKTLDRRLHSYFFLPRALRPQSVEQRELGLVQGSGSRFRSQHTGLPGELFTAFAC
jgi:hypothetical protein